MQPSSLPTPNEGFVMARVSAVCHAEAEEEERGASCKPTSRSPAQCDSTPANPQHIETRPRLMCYSFHVEKQEGPRSRDLVEKRQGAWEECRGLLDVLIMLINE